MAGGGTEDGGWKNVVESTRLARLKLFATTAFEHGKINDDFEHHHSNLMPMPLVPASTTRLVRIRVQKSTARGAKGQTKRKQVRESDIRILPAALVVVARSRLPYLFD